MAPRGGGKQALPGGARNKIRSAELASGDGNSTTWLCLPHVGNEDDGGSGEGSEGEEDDLDSVNDEGEGGLMQSAALAMAAAADKAALELYKKYVLNIVTSHGTMTLDRLHTMLKLLASGGSASNEKFDMTVLQLKRFLQTMVEGDLLEVDDGSYSLRK